MTEQTHLDQRLRVPYSIGTGVPNGGNAEIEGYIHSLRVQGFCVIEREVPEDQVAAARDSVLLGRELLQKDREVERRKRIELARKRKPGAEIAAHRRWVSSSPGQLVAGTESTGRWLVAVGRPAARGTKAGSDRGTQGGRLVSVGCPCYPN